MFLKQKIRKKTKIVKLFQYNCKILSRKKQLEIFKNLYFIYKWLKKKENLNKKENSSLKILYNRFENIWGKYVFYNKKLSFSMNILNFMDKENNQKHFYKLKFILNKNKLDCFGKKINLFSSINIYKNNFLLIRPLFALTRFDTFLICKGLKLPVYPDKSNLQLGFLRNRLRQQIIPAIRILLNPQFDSMICNFVESFEKV